MSHNIAYISYNNQEEGLKNRSIEILDQFFNKTNYSLSDNQSDILFVASGGSEQHAVQRTKNHKNIIVLCHRENNSYAAAIEIAAYLRSNNKKVSLIDVFATNAIQNFNQTQKIQKALNSLTHEKAALIGTVSNWLIISDVETQRIKEKLGIELLRLPWENLSNYKDLEPSSEFLSYFPNQKQEDLHETSKVYNLLKQVVHDNQLSAITVECFSMVVRDKVTACLPLAVLNAQNIVAACEGDICSMLGKMLIRSVTNQIPWQANIAEIKPDRILFAHCTAPLNNLQSFNVTTHFETNCGTAIKGVFPKQKVAAFRINNQLNSYTLIEGEIIDTPNHNFACRTQIEFQTTQNQSLLLKEKSLGNHQLVFPAEYADILTKLMDELQIQRVK